MQHCNSRDDNCMDSAKLFGTRNQFGIEHGRHVIGLKN